MSATARPHARRCRSRGSRAALGSRSRRSRTSDETTRITVRDATPDDARFIAHIRGRAWRAAYDHIFGAGRLATISEDDDTQGWGRWLRNLPPRSGTLVASSGDSVIGFASHGPAREVADIGELYAIYVHPESWGLGAGQALMDATLSRLREHGFDAAVLWVLEDNPRTRSFYELAGWQVDGEVKVEEWLDLIVSEVRYRIDLR